MKNQHVFFIDGFECEVEMIDTHSLFCCATIWKTSDEAIGVEFWLPDIQANDTGVMINYDYARNEHYEESFNYNPYSQGFEYCIDELEYYLINEAEWKRLEL